MDSNRTRREQGFTLVEIMVAITILSIVGVAFMSLMVSTTRATQDAENIVRVSEEARLGFTRMVRDTREAREVLAANATTSAPATEYKIAVDFDRSGTISPEGTVNSQGDYEVLTFSFSGSPGGTGTIRLNGETLIRNVSCVKDSANNCRPMFDFKSNRLEYDSNSDGVVDWQELDAASPEALVGAGAGNGTLDTRELRVISDVVLRFQVGSNDASSDFYSEAQLRNVR